MIALIKAWIQSKLRIIEYCVLGAILALNFYGGYHTRVILDEAAQSKQVVKLINAAPTIVKQTQIIARVIHESNEKCLNVHVPDAIAKQLR